VSQTGDIMMAVADHTACDRLKYKRPVYAHYLWSASSGRNHTRQISCLLLERDNLWETVERVAVLQVTLYVDIGPSASYWDAAAAAPAADAAVEC